MLTCTSLDRPLGPFFFKDQKATFFLAMNSSPRVEVLFHAFPLRPGTLAKQRRVEGKLSKREGEGLLEYYRKTERFEQVNPRLTLFFFIFFWWVVFQWPKNTTKDIFHSCPWLEKTCVFLKHVPLWNTWKDHPNFQIWNGFSPLTVVQPKHLRIAKIAFGQAESQAAKAKANDFFFSDRRFTTKKFLVLDRRFRNTTRSFIQKFLVDIFSNDLFFDVHFFWRCDFFREGQIGWSRRPRGRSLQPPCWVQPEMDASRSRCRILKRQVPVAEFGWIWGEESVEPGDESCFFLEFFFVSTRFFFARDV